MKRTIPLLLGLILLLSAAAFAGEPAATRIFPTWGKIDAETIQSIIEQLPPGVEYILIHAGSEEEDGGVNQFYTPWEQIEPDEVNIVVIPGRIPKNSNMDLRRIAENSGINNITIKFR